MLRHLRVRPPNLAVRMFRFGAQRGPYASLEAVTQL